MIIHRLLLTISLFLGVMAACGDSQLLPQARICVETDNYSLAVDSVSALVEPQGFTRRLDTREAESVKDVRPQFVYWMENGSIRVAVGDYSGRRFAEINVYENASEFSERGAAFFDSLVDHLRATFGDGKVAIKTPPRDSGGTSTSSCGADA